KPHHCDLQNGSVREKEPCGSISGYCFRGYLLLHRPGDGVATILEKFCAHGDEVQAALNVAVPGFFRCLDELVYPGDESLPGMVGDQYLVAHLQHRALAGG